jgi:hypothetical protein
MILIHSRQAQKYCSLFTLEHLSHTVLLQDDSFLRLPVACIPAAYAELHGLFAPRPFLENIFIFPESRLWLT